MNSVLNIIDIPTTNLPSADKPLPRLESPEGFPMGSGGQDCQRKSKLETVAKVEKKIEKMQTHSRQEFECSKNLSVSSTRIAPEALVCRFSSLSRCGMLADLVAAGTPESQPWIPPRIIAATATFVLRSTANNDGYLW